MLIKLLCTDEDFKYFIKENMQYEESYYDEIPKKYPCVICFCSISICGQKWDDEYYDFIYPDIFEK